MLQDQTAEVDFVRAALSLAETSPGILNAEALADGVKEACFTDGGFRWRAYQEAKAHARRGERLTQEALSAVLGPESRAAVASIWPVIPSMGGYRTLASKVRDYATRRSAMDIAKRIQEAATAPTGEFAEGLVSAAAALQGAFSSDGTSVINGRDVMLEFIDRLERTQTGEEEMALRTGLQAWDDCLGGLPRGFVTLIGAYPGCFKSGICATIAANVAFSGRNVGFFSLEDNAQWVAKRFVSAKTGIPVEDMTRRKLTLYEMEKLGSAAELVDTVMKRMEFDHRSGLTGAEVAASARFMVAEKKCDLIVLDHLGETKPTQSTKGNKGQDRHEWLGDNFKMLRDVAKDCNVAVLCAAHLRRNDSSEEDIHRVPKMTDLSDSSQLEKAARVIVGLYQDRETPGDVSLKVLKQNEGSGRGKTFTLRKRLQSAMVE